MPVFNKDDKNYKSHMKIETKYENCKMLYNTGYAPPLSHSGNLGVEAINAQIKMYVSTSFYIPFIIILTLF